MRTITGARADGMTIGELSRHTGVNAETIRYYEKIEVLPRAARTRSGRRVYGAKEMRTLAFIRRARQLGFTLDQIRALLDLGAPTHASCAEVRKIATHHLTEIRDKITDLKRLDALLSKTIRRCSGKAVPECPVIDVLDVRRKKR